MPLKKMRLVAILLAFISLSLYAAEGEGGSRFSTSVSSSAKRGNVSLTAAHMEVPVDSSYILGPGDFLDLFLENYYFSAQVYPDGTIAIDEVGAVEVGGKTLAEARAAILEKTSKRFDPNFTFIQLAQLKAFKVMVMGAVPTVGQITFESQTRLSTLIRVVGGFLPSADKENILLIRNGDTTKINYDEIMRSGSFDEDIFIEQGDRIYIPYVDMHAAVTLALPHARISLPHKEGRTIEEYYSIAMNGANDVSAYRSVKITLPSGKETRLSIPETKTETVEPGAEILYIGNSDANEFVYVGGAVAVMGKVPYNPSFKAIDYIAESGVTTITGSWDQVRVVRGNRETLDVNATEDEILPGDYIEIPKSTYETFKDFTLFLASLLTVVSSTVIIYMNYK